MPFDAIAVSAVKSEIEKYVLGGKIEKIHQPEKDEIRLYIKNEGKQYILLISASPSNPRIHFTHTHKQNPISAPMFCMLMRKHLAGGKIVSAEQPFFDRILDIGVECFDELGDKKTKHIIIEIMSRHSNIILTSDKKVADSVRRVDFSQSSARSVLPGITYEFPPIQDKADPTEASHEEIFERLLSCKSEIPIEKAVVSCFRGTSPAFGREIAYRATHQSDAHLDGTNIKSVCETLEAAFKEIKEEKFDCTVLSRDGKTADFAAYDISYFGSGADVRHFEGMSEAMDEFFTTRDAQERMRQKSASVRKTVSNALERCRKKLALQQEKLADCENADKWRIFGDLLTANLYRLTQGMKTAVLENYYEEDMRKVEIPLDNTKSPQKNAAMYYTKYRKAKTAKEKVGEQLQKNLTEIDYLASVQGSIDIAESEEDLSEIRRELVSQKYIREQQTGKKKQKEKAAAPLRFEYMDYEIYVGRNNRQNDFVTCKMGKSYDMWLHVKDSAGSHVLVKNLGEEIPPDVIEYAAQLAAYYSSVRESKMVQIDYTIIKNVKKPAGALPGKVIYEKYKTAYVAPRKG